MIFPLNIGLRAKSTVWQRSAAVFGLVGVRSQINIRVADLPRKWLCNSGKYLRPPRKTTEEKTSLKKWKLAPTGPAISTAYRGIIMLVPKRPRSVYDHRPVAVQVVKQEKSGAVDKHVLVVDKPKNKPVPPKAK
jgi:hypothetical protein